MSIQPELFLTIQSGPQPGRSFKVTHGVQTIGRTAGNQIMIADPAISRQHAQLTVQPDGVYLQDLGSSNGTFVNGRRIGGPTLLRSGDTIQVGTSVTLGVQWLGQAVGPRSAAGASTGGFIWLMGAAAVLVIIALGVAAWLLLAGTQPDGAAGPATPESTPTGTPTVMPVPAVEMVFNVANSTVQMGECTTLRWQVSGAKEVRLNGEKVPAAGSRQICPQQSTQTYRLLALSLVGETVEQAIVLTVPPTPPPPPELRLEFSTDQVTVLLGDCTTLRWSVENAQEVRLGGDKVGATGSQQVCPTEPSSSYKLVIQPLEGPTVERVVIISVPPTPMPSATPTSTPVPPTSAAPVQAGGPAIDSFTADQYTVGQGGCTSLRWTVRSAQAVQLSGGEIGSQSVGNQGARQVCPPAASTTYNLAATGGTGSDQRSLTISIVAPTVPSLVQPVPVNPPPSGITGPPIIKACVVVLGGACYIYRWDIKNVREVYFDGRGVAGENGDSGKLCGSDYNTGKKGKLEVVHLDGSRERVDFYPPTSDRCN